MTNNLINVNINNEWRENGDGSVMQGLSPD